MIKQLKGLIIYGFWLMVLLLATIPYISPILADDNVQPGIECKPATDKCVSFNNVSFSCQPTKSPPPDYACQPDVFGQIKPPDALKPFTSPDPTGASGISRFLSNLVGLFYAAAFIVVIFMLLWGSFDWITSEGDKEKMESAKRKIINAIIGIILFAITFAILQVLGTFTGFKFFVGQR